jgi:hypothetical protein
LEGYLRLLDWLAAAGRQGGRWTVLGYWAMGLEIQAEQRNQQQGQRGILVGQTATPTDPSESESEIAVMIDTDGPRYGRD